ncbi:MAG: hypothetical protein Q7R90_01565 [bacterium]|nr:hypothetical protein [bacterium]
MPDKKSVTRTVTGEVLPPERRDVQLPPNTPAGIPFLAQAKYWAARRALESYTKALGAQAAAYRELEARERARQGFERSLVQSEHLDDLRRIEELKIVDELASLVESSEVREYRTRALKAQTEAEAIEAERRLDAVKNPPAPEPKNERSAAERAGIDIAQMRTDAEALKKTLIECYGGEDKLTAEDRDLLGQVDVAIRNKIVGRLENL